MHTRQVRLSAWTLIILAGTSGCVSGKTFEEAQQKAYAQHQQDQQYILDLNVTNRRLKQRVEELESTLHTTREQLARVEKEWKDVRDELLKLKIEREQQPKRRDRLGLPHSDDDFMRLRERLDEAKRRARELLQQLQGLVEQF